MNTSVSATRRMLNCKCICCKTTIKNISDANFVFDENGAPNDIKNLLNDCIGMQLQVADNLNVAVCSACTEQLQQSYVFKQMCIQTSAKKMEVVFDDEPKEECDDTSSRTVEDIAFASTLEALNGDGKNSYPSTSYEMVELVESEGVEYLEELTMVEEETVTPDNQPTEMDLGDCLTVDSYKQKFRQLVPTHQSYGTKRDVCGIIPPVETDCTSLDVEKIATSDDLIKILEDDYNSENDTTRTLLDKDMDNAEFKIPKIEVWDVCEDVEYLEEEKPIDIDDYLMAISATFLNENEPFSEPIVCTLCNHFEIGSFSSLVRHVMEVHHLRGKLDCCICSKPQKSFANETDLKNHLFVDHGDLVNPTILLTCQTCYGVFNSVVKFGKHCCVQKEVDSSIDENFTCNICEKQLISKKRYLFHQQFHMPTPRPKVCLVCQISFDDELKFYEHVNFSHELFSQHSCMFCDKSFTTEWEWRRHENGHTAERNYGCSSCGKMFLNKQTLHEHEVSHHLPEAHLKCEVCSRAFSRKSRLRKHLQMHLEYVPHLMPMCTECHRIFANDEAGLDHLEQFHGGGTDQITLKFNSYDQVLCCEFCESAFQDPHVLVAHKLTHTDALKYECSHCPAKYDQYGRLRTHCTTHKIVMEDYPVQRLYMCDEETCLKPFRDWKNLQSHRKTVHLINPTIFKCDECDETFYQSWTYSYHKKRVHTDHLRCPFCDQTFVLVKSLQNHVSRFHVNDMPAQPAKRSSTAAKSVPLTFDFEKYLVEKTDGFWYCRTCDKKCNSRHNAATHVQMVHLKVKNFHCDICPKGFFMRGDYTDHMRLHSEETPFECSYCDYKTRKKSMLRDHIRKHTNERPYECKICRRSFKRRYVLNMHLKRHSGTRSFSCPQCGKEYITQAALNSHVKRTHVKIENLLQERKRKAVSMPIKGKSVPKVIIIMPGPVSKAST